jgi:nucleoside-diphosphate-sugar epimerase
MTILVTGGTGFLGQRVVRGLLDQGHHVRCLSRSGPADDSWLSSTARERCEFVRGDLSDAADCTRLVDECEIVIHLASSLFGSVPYLFLANVVGTQNLLASVANSSVKRFVHVSSLAVYGVRGLRAKSRIDEHCPLDPMPHLRDPYTYSKVVQERIVWESLENSDVSLVVVRPGVIYGPQRSIVTSRVGISLGNVLIRMGRGKRLPYVYVDNCADAVVAAAFAPNADGKAVNVIDDMLPSSRQLLKAYKRAGNRLFVLRVPQCLIMPLSRLNEWYVQRSQGQLPMVLSRYKSDAMWKNLDYDNSLAKCALEWEPRIDLQEGLRRTLKAG